MRHNPCSLSGRPDYGVVCQIAKAQSLVKGAQAARYVTPASRFPGVEPADAIAAPGTIPISPRMRSHFRGIVLTILEFAEITFSDQGCRCSRYSSPLRTNRITCRDRRPQRRRT